MSKGWMEKMEARRKEKNDLKTKLAQEHGIVGHPKLDLLFDIAWDRGHHAGENEVSAHFDQMLPLIK